MTRPIRRDRGADGRYNGGPRYGTNGVGGGHDSHEDPAYGGHDRDYERGYDRYGNRSYDRYGETPAERYYREQDAQRRDTRNTAIRWTGIVLVALIGAVALILIAFALTGGGSSEGAQQIPQQQPVQPAPQQQAPQQAPQQPQPVQPAPPQAPQAPAVPDNSQQIEGLRAEMQRQFAELRYSINQLRLEIMSWWAGGQDQQNSAQ